MAVVQDPAAFTTLPREFYLEGPLFEAEAARIWYDHWLYLAHVSELAEPGDFVVRELLGGESVLVTRTADGEIAAMLNVCRHRGARMIDDRCGTLKRVVCPYHQWTYDLDGRLVGAPSMPNSEVVDYDSLGLYRLPLEVWNGLVFGCLGEQAPAPIGPEIDRLAPRLREYEPERLRKVAAKTYACAANWKVMLENYLECYHCSASHPEFCMTADLRVRASDEYTEQALHNLPYWSTEVPLRAGMYSASRDGRAVCRVQLSGGDELTAGNSRSFGDWAGATALYFYADYAMVHQIDPIGPTETRFHLTWLVHEAASDDDFDVDEMTHVWDMTTQQDVALIERTQAGLRSRRYTPGPLSLKHEPYIRSSLNTYLATMEGDELVAELLDGAG
jgi:phenylpropionate dioxygenase-like ring-hydroxylating dioxygenase large terminal subunit